MALIERLRSAREMLDYIGIAVRAAEEFERCRFAERMPVYDSPNSDRDMPSGAVPL